MLTVVTKEQAKKFADMGNCAYQDYDTGYQYIVTAYEADGDAWTLGAYGSRAEAEEAIRTAIENDRVNGIDDCDYNWVVTNLPKRNNDYMRFNEDYDSLAAQAIREHDFKRAMELVLEAQERYMRSK